MCSSSSSRWRWAAAAAAPAVLVGHLLVSELNGPLGREAGHNPNNVADAIQTKKPADNEPADLHFFLSEDFVT
jgi:hypothetical protein